MKILLDSANLSEIRWAITTGLIEGVTTNPTLVANDAPYRDHKAYLGEICRLVSGPVSVEVVATDADDMYREGKELAKVADNVVVNVPMIEEGLVAIRRMVADGIRVNVTLIFTPAQALFAAKAGASMVSPFIGHLDEIGQDGIGLIADIRHIFDNYDMECAVLASSVRSAAHFTEAAKIGADAVAVPTAVLKALLLHPLTDRGLDQFLNDWSKQIAKSRAGA
ncbi:MAG TPA: fructose-6-phosphate aldolase [Gemmatimonadaceae bacterium]|nr:fructose-6-phosphate aldolase [Gemmatimonadaceae bacterium]